MLILTLAALAGAGTAAAWFVDHRRARRRNETGCCAMCGIAWSEAAEDRYLIHGRLVCEACAERAKTQMPKQFGIIVASTGVATGGMGAAYGLAAMVAFPAVTTVAMTTGAVWLMKSANREAQRRIASGEYPGYHALEAGDTEPSPESLANPDPDA